MISKRYIDEGINELAFDETYTSFIEYADASLNELALIRYDIEAPAILSRYGRNRFTFMEADGDKKAGVLERIGDKIKEIFKKIKKLIDDLMDKIRGIGFENKSVLDKYEAFKKKHPDQAARLKVEIDKGLIDLDVIKSLKDLDDAYEEAVKASEKKDADVSAIKQKWDNFTKKFGEEETKRKVENAKTIVTIATAVATLGTSVAIAHHQLNKWERETTTEYAKLTQETLHRDNADPDNPGASVRELDDNAVSLRLFRAGMQLNAAKIRADGHASLTLMISHLRRAILHAIDNPERIERINQDHPGRMDGRMAQNRADKQNYVRGLDILTTVDDRNNNRN